MSTSSRTLGRARQGPGAYQVFSNPLVADADFDGLVDFDEYFNGTDPNNGNTDGDSRDDGVEVRGNSDPLAPNIQVTAVVKSASFGGNGVFDYQLSVRMPDDAGIAGLSADTSRIYGSDADAINEIGKVRVHLDGAYYAFISYRYLTPSGEERASGEESAIFDDQTKTYDPGDKGVPVGPPSGS